MTGLRRSAWTALRRTSIAHTGLGGVRPAADDVPNAHHRAGRPLPHVAGQAEQALRDDTRRIAAYRARALVSDRWAPKPGQVGCPGLHTPGEGTSLRSARQPLPLHRCRWSATDQLCEPACFAVVGLRCQPRSARVSSESCCPRTSVAPITGGRLRVRDVNLSPPTVGC